MCVAVEVGWRAKKRRKQPNIIMFIKFAVLLLGCCRKLNEEICVSLSLCAARIGR
jgi:hypothetical protein